MSINLNISPPKQVCEVDVSRVGSSSEQSFVLSFSKMKSKGLHSNKLYVDYGLILLFSHVSFEISLWYFCVTVECTGKLHLYMHLNNATEHSQY